MCGACEKFFRVLGEKYRGYPFHGKAKSTGFGYN